MTDKKSQNINGGARPGAGRPKGALNRKTVKTIEAVEDGGITPLEYMLMVMRSELADPRERLSAANSAAPYVHAKLASIELTGAGGGPIKHSLEIGFR